MSFGQCVSLLSFVLSMGTIAITYTLATAAGDSPLCNPFIDGCTDITHTGMKGDAGFVFRGGLISACIFFIVWWQCMSEWLKPYANAWLRHIQTLLGVVAAVGLIVGTAVLVPDSDQIPWNVHVRGANLFFQGMLIGLTLNYYLVFRAKKQGLLVPSFKLKTILMVLIWMQFFIFAGTRVGIEMGHSSRILEWWSTLFIGIYYLSAFWDWKSLRLKVENQANQ
ncbi:MAG: hypothetical protein ACPGYX_00565 [Oceanobacter sp.]